MKMPLVAAAVLAVTSAGCQTQCPVKVARNAAPDPPSETPLIIDEAMQARAWEPMTANYANGNTVAWPTLFRYEPAWNQPEVNYIVLETPLFVTQVIGIPIMLVATPPWKHVTYTGVTVEPTYNAMPALPQATNVVTEAPTVPPEPAEPAPEPTAQPAQEPAAPPATQP